MNSPDHDSACNRSVLSTIASAHEWDRQDHHLAILLASLRPLPSDASGPPSVLVTVYGCNSHPYASHAGIRLSICLFGSRAGTSRYTYSGCKRSRHRTLTNALA